MTFEIWLAFVAATVVMLVIPGPTILLVIGYALGSGRRTALWSVPGVALGDTVAMTASLAGLGAVLAASAEAFTVLKWLGAAYLVYLGIRMWCAAPDLAAAEPQRERGHGLRVTAHAFVVTALNPKGIVFFVAFLPQFVTPDTPVLPQLLVLAATFVSLAIVNTLVYIALAGGLRQRISEPRTLRLVNRLAGGVLVAAGLFMTTMRRAAA